jgi:hypothetical protein
VKSLMASDVDPHRARRGQPRTAATLNVIYIGTESAYDKGAAEIQGKRMPGRPPPPPSGRKKAEMRVRVSAKVNAPAGP